MATLAECCRRGLCESGPLQSPSLLSLRRFAENAKASSQFAAPAAGENLFYVAAIRTRGGCFGASAGRKQRKCRGQLLAVAHLPGFGCRVLTAPRELFAHLLTSSPVECGRLRASPESRRRPERVSSRFTIAAQGTRAS